MSEAFADERGRVPHSANLAASLQRAAIYAEEQGHRLITLEHLLLALTEDPEAVSVLQISHVDLDVLRNESAGLVGLIDDRVPLDSQVPPQTSSELRRVIDAATMAAGSKRRAIDGAIVLAALIGEGHSAAAELLKAMGLTFDAAIKTMRMRPLESGATAPTGRTQSAGRVAPRAEPPRADPVPRTQRRPAAGDLYPPPAAALGHGHGPGDVPRTASQRANAAPVMPWQESAPAYAGQAPARGRRPEDERYADPYAETPANGAMPAPRSDSRTGRQEPPGETAAASRSAGARSGRDKPRKPGKPKVGEPRAERGPLILTLERRVRRGQAETIEARISLRSLDALGMTLQPAYAGRPDPGFATRALTVRLRAPEDSALVETLAPETQWVETAIGLQEDDFGGWRWTLVPQRSGKLALRFSVSSRALASDGIASEQALPDQIVEVRVRGTPWRAIGRVVGWLALLAAALATGGIVEHMFKLISHVFG